MTRKLKLGISTCPNDTFAFCGILEKRVDFRDLEFEVELLDVQQLNEALFEGDFDVAKASFHAALLLSEELGVLASGSALGFGVGPLLLSARPGMQPGANDYRQNGRVLCPGRHTTAALLYQLFHPREGNIEHVVFSDIMPALQAGEADFGVCIHEGRFTREQHGLGFVEDLGETWERHTNAPLPLGGILARRSLGEETLKTIQAVIRDSLEYGLQNRQATLPTMKRYAQELEEDVVFAHVDLYVNKWTLDLGSEGRHSLQQLGQQARQVGLIPADQRDLEIFPSA